MIREMDHCSQPLLKAYMQEGRPAKFDGGELTVVYDEDSDAHHVTALRKERPLLDTLLKRVSRRDGATVNVVFHKGVDSPIPGAALRTSEQEEIVRKAGKNQFVQDVMSLFDAEIVDVRG
jgi:hypothetical protein